MTDEFKRELLPDTRTCYRYLQAGFGIVLVTFVGGLVALGVPAVLAVFEVLVMPALFVGLGLLLFGVGTHLHIMHLNALEMRQDRGGGH